MLLEYPQKASTSEPDQMGICLNSLDSEPKPECMRNTSVTQMMRPLQLTLRRTFSGFWTAFQTLVDTLDFPSPLYLSLCPATRSQNTSEATHVKHIQPFLLVCMHCPSLTSVKQSAAYTGFIYIDFGMFCKRVDGPYLFCEPGECHGSLSNSLIEFTVNGQVVCDGRPQVHKFMNDL